MPQNSHLARNQERLCSKKSILTQELSILILSIDVSKYQAHRAHFLTILPI